MIASIENTVVTTEVQNTTVQTPENNPYIKAHLDAKRETAERQTAETQRLLRNQAVLQKVRRMLYHGHLVQMRDAVDGDLCGVVNVELSGDRFLGYRSENELPWQAISGDHVQIGGEKFRLNGKPTTKPFDPAIELLDLAVALNSMMDYRTGSVFIACSFYDGEDFFLVRRFQTDGLHLCAIAAHDGSCHDLVPGCCWVYDLKHRRYVYGEGGPLENDPR